jgi:glucose/arabinose dehydrogenase
MRTILCAVALSLLFPVAASPAGEALRAVPVIRDVSMPTQVTHAGDGSGRLFVLEQAGRVLVYKSDGSGGFGQGGTFLDITGRTRCCGERGLLGMAFPSRFRDSGVFYVHYSGSNGDTVISRFSVLPGTGRADPESEEVLLRVRQPFTNHNGGQIAFGPDGLLYIGLGDGGSGGDPLGNGQKKDTLLGKILRIKVGTDGAYEIPPDNPFAGRKGYRGEIWALGLRNPWRFSFDRATGDLYIADVGQNRYEEINFEPSGSSTAIRKGTAPGKALQPR